MLPYAHLEKNPQLIQRTHRFELFCFHLGINQQQQKILKQEETQQNFAVVLCANSSTEKKPLTQHALLNTWLDLTTKQFH